MVIYYNTSMPISVFHLAVFLVGNLEILCANGAVPSACTLQTDSSQRPKNTEHSFRQKERDCKDW